MLSKLALVSSCTILREVTIGVIPSSMHVPRLDTHPVQDMMPWSGICAENRKVMTVMAAEGHRGNNSCEDTSRRMGFRDSSGSKWNKIPVKQDAKFVGLHSGKRGMQGIRDFGGECNTKHP